MPSARVRAAARGASSTGGLRARDGRTGGKTSSKPRSEGSESCYISDPEAEYAPLVNSLLGQVIRISPTSKEYINPMDINLNYSKDSL